jgi:cell division septation protein DedD
MSKRDEFDSFAPVDTIGEIFKAMEQRDGVKPRRTILSLGVICALLAFAGTILWYSYPLQTAQNDDDILALPIIRADAGPFRELPDDPGGMDIPFRDSTVFDTMRTADSKANAPRIENLLEDENNETVPRAQLFAGLITEFESETLDDVEVQKQANVEDIAPEPIQTQIQIATLSSYLVPAKKPVRESRLNQIEPANGVHNDVIKSVSAPKAQPVRAVQPPASLSGGFYVQLASLKSEPAAKAEWGAMQARYGNLLGGMPHRVISAVIADKGTFYRLQAGPFERAAADRLCSDIKTQTSGGCFVLAP